MRLHISRWHITYALLFAAWCARLISPVLARFTLSVALLVASWFIFQWFMRFPRSLWTRCFIGFAIVTECAALIFSIISYDLPPTIGSFLRGYNYWFIAAFCISWGLALISAMVEVVRST